MGSAEFSAHPFLSDHIGDNIVDILNKTMLLL